MVNDILNLTGLGRWQPAGRLSGKAFSGVLGNRRGLDIHGFNLRIYVAIETQTSRYFYNEKREGGNSDYMTTPLN